ncbi:MAG: hypothetical protein ABUJ92_00040 [Desulfobacterales bacterium]
MSTEVDLWRYLSGLLMLPLGWMWHRMNGISSKTDETRITLAERHYTKLEVHDLVDRQVGPILEKLDEIREDIKYLVREKRD